MSFTSEMLASKPYASQYKECRILVRGVNEIIKSKITNFILIIGVIVFVVGFYSMFFKAGLPCSDPAPEMTRIWMFYYNDGKSTMPFGAILVKLGIVFKLLI